MSTTAVDRILFGAAYYDEYMPDLEQSDGLDADARADRDMAMMKAAGINVIRIAESTWSTCEPQPGEFDFSHVDRALDAAHRAGIDVIVGTPTYAVPAWLVHMHPDVLAVTPNGPGSYGARQIMDIVSPAYRFYGERVIRRLIAHVAAHPAVIGYQVDNETKYYDSVSLDMQTLFVKYLREKFHGDLDELNRRLGLDYWSNRVDSWEDFPDVTGSINQSLRGEFDRFRRDQVARFLAWQADIVREYARDDQFITQNFDYEWRGYSYGVQPAVDHFKAARGVDITGVDIYHPTEDELTGKEIAFGGDMARSTKDGANYLVIETEAQGQHGWLPFPGQLRLQAYSHLASGADSVMYWHWHSIHHSYETYWKGLISHDLEPNPTYEEAGVFGREIAADGVGDRLIHLKKRNRVAIMVSNESLSALEWFRIETGFPDGVGINYNDVVRRIYDALFELNVECDFVPVDAGVERLGRYAMVIAPALYCAPQETIDDLRAYVRDGGHAVATMRSFVTDDEVTVWHDRAPHDLTDVFGMSYNQFTRPKGRVGVAFADGMLGEDVAAGDVAAGGAVRAEALIELLKVMPKAGTEVLARYDHYAWKDYAAVTRHAFGDQGGWGEWIGTMLDASTMRAVLREAVVASGIASDADVAAAMSLAGTVTVRRGENAAGESVTYLLNYSPEPVRVPSPAAGTVLVGGSRVATDGSAVDDPSAGPAVGTALRAGEEIVVGPWNLAVIAG
ncbi:beta-galactosidase [Bifidobacterium tissieri]|uniref:beta-galactosidase n=1 Tax=Bifidobacterium tissieri TaxID=1630162 RepID=A0A5M9ZTZ3_9BIFI|nr:beta-galactosidase [Bifidobacterium tissieri]KAA8830126.1 beta-galactosidase [Bifidobacterium tissieri]KAA8830929.1 beta-galactosidase [Bifidobacterium tissieri]